jgi:hypothetical protein
MPAPSIAAPSSAGPPSTITRTGKHETIAGYDCEDWNVTTGAKHSAVCVAEGIPFFDFAAMASHGGAATGRSWADELRDKKGFPLRAVETDESGKETSRMEVTKIAKQTLDDELFTAPKGYNVMHVPGGAGLAGLANMPHPPK